LAPKGSPKFGKPGFSYYYYYYKTKKAIKVEANNLRIFFFSLFEFLFIFLLCNELASDDEIYNKQQKLDEVDIMYYI